MKTIFKRIGALALTGAMCVSLFGCGDKKEQDSQHKLLADELGFGYLADYQDLNAELEYLQSTTMAGGKLYLQGYYYNEEDMEQSGDRIYELDPTTGETKTVTLPKLESGENSSENIQAMALSPDGSGYWLVTNLYTYTPMEGEALPEEEAPEVTDPEAPADGEEADGAEAPTEEAAPGADEAPAEEGAGLSGAYTVDMLSNTVPADGAAVMPVDITDDAAEVQDEEPESSVEEPIMDAPVSGDDQNRYMAKKYDMSGRMLQEINLTDAVAEEEWFYCQAVAQDGEGNLYIAANDGKVLCFDKTNQRLDDIDLNTYYVQSLVTAGNGVVLATYYEAEGDGGTAISRLENGKASDAMKPEGVSDTGSLYIYGGEDDTVLLSDGNMLYHLNVTTGETSKLLSWLDSDINASSISGVAGSEDKLLVVLSRDISGRGEYTFELGTLTKTEAKDLPEQTILTLGAEYLDEKVRNAVVNFKRTNGTYRITLVDYSTYNTTEDYTLGSKQLELDVVSGNSPDLISLSGAKVDKYIGKGALVNLSELLGKDETISEEDLMSGPLQGFSKDGKLYGMPYSFSVQTIYGSAKLLGERESWNTKEMAEVLEGLPEDVKVMSYSTQQNFLSMMLYNNLGTFVDYEKATCSFDSEEFKSLMEAAAHLPEDPEENESGSGIVEAAAYTDEIMDERQQVQQGDILLTNGYIYDASSVKEFMNLYTQDNGFVKIGYPVDSGSGAVLSVNGGLAIAESCKEKDGAWAFIKTVLADDFQKNQWEMPVTVSAFDEMMKETQEPPYYMRNGEKVYQDSTTYIGNTEYKLAELTDAQVQEFKDFVNGASRVMTTYDSDLMEIVSEESAAFFAGDKTADEVAKLIQNKASIYLGENS